MSNLVVSNISDGTTSVGTGYVVNGSAKAWFKLDSASGNVLGETLNISSLTDNGVGEVFPNITSAFNGSNYATVGGSNGAGVVNYSHFEIRRETVSQINIRTFRSDTNALADFYFVYGAAFGELA